MHERFARRKTWRRAMAVLYVASLCVYLGWRLTILAPYSMPLSVTYFIADFIGFVLGLAAIYASWDYRHRDPPPAPANLSVDVFVTTYKEPLHIIRRTVLAARDIAYPHNTLVLDDGRREEIRALAAELGVAYLSRPDNAHAKAGNLNFGLAQTRAEFVMTFDADHIALPHALDVMLGFFSDPNVAMVQTPQDYYNTNAFQYVNARRSGGLWHDQSFFYNVGQPCADLANAATCVGTGVVYRRAALARIGGVPTDTVTEDIHTSLKFHKQGFETVYLNEPVAYGVAAADLREYYKTRHRWAHGNLHAVRLEKIFTRGNGLSWRQRLHYLALNLQYLEGWQQLLLFIIPVIALVFGLQPFQITIFNMLVVLAFPFYAYVLLQEHGCGFTRYWANELFSMARFPVHLAAAAGLLGRKTPFRSSAKNVQGRVNWRLMSPQLAVIAVSLLATAIGVLRLHHNFRIGPLFRYVISFATSGHAPQGANIHAVMSKGYTVDLVAIAGFWALYSVTRGACFVLKVFRDSRNSHEYFRFDMPLPARIRAVAGREEECFARIDGIAEDWVRFTVFGGQPPRSGDSLGLTVFLPAGPLELTLRVGSVRGRTVEGALLWSSPAAQDMLANGLYSVDWHREFLHRNAYFLTPAETLARCLRLESPWEGKHRDWQAILYARPGETEASACGVISPSDDTPGFASLITFQNLSPGVTVAGHVFAESVAAPLFFMVTGEEALSSLTTKGLDGAIVYRYRVRIVAQMTQGGNNLRDLGEAG
jgi:cellulose synthase (UDP-forming)